MTPSKEIWLIRHGETEWSRTGKHTGRTDVPLSDTGELRARALGSILSAASFETVLTSPLARAVETCRLSGLGDRARVTPDLMEWDYGIFEGRKTPEIRAERPNWSIWETDIPQGEQVDDVARRADRVIEEVSATSGNVAVFSHGHFLRIMTARWLGLPPTAGRLFALDTGSVSVIGYERETRVIRVWNRSV